MTANTVSDSVHKDIQIHIHEHVGPLRERVGKLEGRMDVQDRELTLLRQGLESLRDRIDQTRTAILDMLSQNADRGLQALSEHERNEFAKDDVTQTRLDALTATGAVLAEKIDATKNWMIAIGTGAAIVLAAVEFLNIIGILK